MRQEIGAVTYVFIWRKCIQVFILIRIFCFCLRFVANIANQGERFCRVLRSFSQLRRLLYRPRQFNEFVTNWLETALGPEKFGSSLITFVHRISKPCHGATNQDTRPGFMKRMNETETQTNSDYLADWNSDMKNRPSPWIAAIVLASPAMAYCGGNTQTVELTGGAANVATTGGTAVMNIASTSGAAVVSGNSQQVVVRGVVLNAASNGAHSELNIASRSGPAAGKGSQVISVQGPVVTQASGRGVKSVVNIGGR